MYNKRFINILFFCLFCSSLFAQTIQSPEEFLQFKKGQRFLRHHQVVSYYEYIAAQFPKQVKLIQYGSTNEGRPLLVAVVASAENFANLEEIRTNNLKAIGLLDGKPTDRKQPAIAWMSYNVHGNESCGTNTAPFVLHELLNPNNTRSKAILANTVVLLDPSINPDGYDRYANWYNQKVGATFNANPAAWEHSEPWPGGRYNHYLFDLNRDWAWQVQKESQARMALYRQWMPQLHADFHEQGVESPYYFSPAAKPYHEDITTWQRDFQRIIGDYNKKDFDKNGWLYFSKERFDLLYPSYGDTYPTYNGAFGMTYEQGGSGRAGLGIAKRDGDTLTLKQRIDHHFSTSFACLDAISANADKAVSEFYKFHSNAISNPVGTYKTFIIKTKGEESRVKEFLTYLDKEGFQYGTAGKDMVAAVAYGYNEDKTSSLRIEADDIVLSLYQPRSTLLKILMEPKTMVEDSLTYDITAWSLPYAYGLKAYALKDRLMPAGKVAFKTSISKNENAYAYLAKWQSFTDLKFLASLMQKGIKVRAAVKSFEIDNQSYPAGTLIITRTGNEALGNNFDQIVFDEAQRLQVNLVPVNTGMPSKGSDFGSENVVFLKKPRIATLAGDGVSATGFGEVWHFFDQQIGFPITVLPDNSLGNANLSAYDVLILPGGGYRSLNDTQLNKLKDWVRAGGKLIAIENALKVFAGKEGFDLKTKEDDKKKETDESKLKIYGNAEREALSEETSGSIYRVTLDTTHPLAFGYPSTYFSLVLEGTGYQYLSDGWNVGITKGKDLMAGFAGVKAQEKLKNALIFGDVEFGQGHIIYMANNPLFRGFWQNGKLLFGNAVFMVGN